MTELDRQCLSDGLKYREIHIACGGCNFVRMESITGFCHCSQHKGYVTETILKNHDCLSKQCSWYERFDDYPYWVQKKELKESFPNYYESYKEKCRIEKEQERLRQIRKEALLDECKRKAEELVEKYQYPIKVVSAREFEEGKIRIFFVSDIRWNDSQDYMDMEIELHEKFPQMRFWMKRIIKANGLYARFADFRG